MFILTSNVLRILFHLLSLLRIRWPIEGQVSRCSLLSLPDEVLYRVFHYIDCWGILALRLTCGRLYSISKSHLLWRFKALEESYSSGVPLLEEPVESYTSEELEEKLITRARNSQKWRNLDPASFQWRKIEVGYSYQTRYELKWLLGGRWLLRNLKGCVSIMDLDGSESIRVPLFDVSDSADPLHRSTIWIDPTRCWLSPRMALHCRDTTDHEGRCSSSAQQFDAKKPPQDSSRICVYQLNSTGRGLNMKWDAEEIAIIRTSACGMKGELQLEKEHVLERCMHPDGSGYLFKAYLYHYSDSHLRSCQWDWESQTLLLPRSRISVVTLTHIKLFTINPVGSDGLELQPTFCTLLDPVPLPQEIYRLHSTLYYSCLSIAGHDSLLEIQFPHNANEVHQETITYSRGPIPRLKGPSLLVRQLDNCSADFISYKLGEHSTRQIASQICVSADAFRNRSSLIACDETSGRLITSEHCEYTLLQV